MNTESRNNENRRLYRRMTMGAVGFLAIIVFLLFTEHQAHVLGFLPWLLLLACCALHFLMPGGHGGHGGHGGDGEGTDTPTTRGGHRHE